MEKKLANIPILATEENCTGCLACVDTCKQSALNVEEKYNHLYPFVDTNKCIGCGACEKTCPIITPITNSYDPQKVKVIAAWSNDDNIRMNSASGGFCTVLALDTIKNGGKVALCTWKDGKAIFTLTDNAKDVIDAANSKYVHSDASGIYRKVKEVLDTGDKVLFIGLPCQVAGLKGFLRKKQYGEKLRTIELICSAPPSDEAVKLQEKVAYGQLIRFRTKTTVCYWGKDYNVQMKSDGETLILEQNKHQAIFYKIFASMLTARYSCMHCQYAKMERIADYTVGDFHGHRTEGWQKGISLVICKDEKLYQEAKLVETIESEDSTLRNALLSNSRLYTGWEALRYHPANVFRGLFSKMPIEFRLKVLTNKFPYKILWIIYKVFTKVNIVVQRKFALKKI